MIRTINEHQARARLPEGYDRWVGLIEKWEKSFGRQRARYLIERLVAAFGDRPREILGHLFDRLEHQICDHLPKKVQRLGDRRAAETDNAPSVTQGRSTLRRARLGRQLRLFATIGSGQLSSVPHSHFHKIDRLS
jgi:hypothetical protein